MADTRIDYLTIKKLAREREILAAYIAHHGRITDLGYLCDKYTKEDDGKIFSLRILYNHLNDYLASPYITEKELDSYKKANRLPKSLVLKRGEELVDTFLKSGRWNDCLKFRNIYAQEDGKLWRYDREVLEKYISYFLNHTMDTEKVMNYKWWYVARTKSYNAPYNMQNIDELLSLKEMDQRRAYIEELGISKTNLHNMINIASLVAPEKRPALATLEPLLAQLPKPEHRDYDYKDYRKKNESSEESYSERLKRRREEFIAALDEYMSVDEQDFYEWIYLKHGFTLEQTRYNLDHFRKYSPEYVPLINDVLAKHRAYVDKHMAELESFRIMLEEGIMKNGKLTSPTAYDYYQTVTIPPKDALEMIFRERRWSNLESVHHFITAKVLGRIYPNREELKAKVNFIYENSEPTEAEKDAAIDYIIYRQWPLTDSLYIAILKEHIINNLDLDHQKSLLWINKRKYSHYINRKEYFYG